jgi:hypothetical protein
MFRKWKAYHAANPVVYDKLVEILREAQEKGFDYWSIQGAVEVLRWECRMPIVGEDEFKISNSYAAYYARWIMMHEHDLYGFIETHASAADHSWELGWTNYKKRRDAEPRIA